jgi:hypothetical protein
LDNTVTIRGRGEGSKKGHEEGIEVKKARRSEGEHRKGGTDGHTKSKYP